MLTVSQRRPRPWVADEGVYFLPPGLWMAGADWSGRFALHTKFVGEGGGSYRRLAIANRFICATNLYVPQTGAILLTAQAKAVTSLRHDRGG